MKTMKTNTIKTYSELIAIPTFEERFEYLKLNGSVGSFTFNGYRQLNQMLYKTDEWKRIRRDVILRDDGCDLADPDYPIRDYIYIHHIVPITIEDILGRRDCVFDLNNLISCSFATHNAIHYSDETVTRKPVERRPNDTCLWR